MVTVALSSKGQLVIPKAVREHMGAKAGAIFAVRYADGELHLKPVEARSPTSLDEVAGFLARPGRKALTARAEHIEEKFGRYGLPASKWLRMVRPYTPSQALT